MAPVQLTFQLTFSAEPQPEPSAPPAPTKTSVEPGWDDIRLPDAYYAFFKAHGTCPNCRVPLRHPIHAFNHFKKFHMARIKK